MEVQAEVVRVSGTCDAALQAGDSFLVSGTDIHPQCHDRTCASLCAVIVLNAGRLRLAEGPLYVSCPDPGTGEGGNVLVRLSLVSP
jgi:uncharacterized repeat protein (TIGR04076 family)